MRDDDAAARSHLSAALQYLTHGLAVIPCCWALDGRPEGCLPHGSWCAWPGKRPMIDWVAYQSRLPTWQEATTWWTNWPEANLGLVLGERGGVVAVDCDGDTGDAVVRAAGPLPPTWRVETGMPGHYHLLFAYASRLPRVRQLFAGVGLLAGGAISVVPPSRHWTGRRYRWAAAPWGTQLAPLPEWLVARARTTAFVPPKADRVHYVAADILHESHFWGVRPTLGEALGQPDDRPLELLALLRARVDALVAAEVDPPPTA